MADGAGDFFVFVRGERDGGDEADGEPGPFVCSVLVFAGVCWGWEMRRGRKGEVLPSGDAMGAPVAAVVTLGGDVFVAF